MLTCRFSCDNSWSWKWNTIYECQIYYISLSRLTIGSWRTARRCKILESNTILFDSISRWPCISVWEAGTRKGALLLYAHRQWWAELRRRTTLAIDRRMQRWRNIGGQPSSKIKKLLRWSNECNSKFGRWVNTEHMSERNVDAEFPVCTLSSIYLPVVCEKSKFDENDDFSKKKK